MARAKVAVLWTKPETVLDDYRRLMKMADADKFIDASKTTILKDNISWHMLFPGANTTPWQMEGSILGLRDIGNRDIVCVQNETVVTNAFKGERLNKFVPVLRHYNIPVLYNFRDEDMKWEIYKPKAEMRVLHRIYPEGFRIPDYFHGKNILHQPTVKCHIYTKTTGAMKNAFGGLLNRKRHYTHSVIHETLCDLLAVQKEIHPGIFCVMDGTTAGNGPGPRTMIPVEKNVILASGDQVAIDAVAAKMMGFDPMSIKYIRLAHESGLGVGDMKEIEIVGDDVSGESWNFHVGDNFVSSVGSSCWFGPLKWLQRLMFHTPLVYPFIWGSAVYHDMYWYPFKGKPVVRKWLDTTQWGRLFSRYERELAKRPR
ncbi:MAG: DUF362 domain-containing protein [Planctomycetota bacterium]|jgi:uncharacterized protein (DUF362 family)